MKMANRRWFLLLLQWLITIAMAVGALIIIALPLVVQWALNYYEIGGNADNAYTITCLSFLYPSGILGMAILYQARKILIKVNENQPFVAENVKRIRTVARLSAGLCVIYAVAVFFIQSFFAPILCVVFGMTALLLSVFGELFQKAVEYKNDNDFTI